MTAPTPYGGGPVAVSPLSGLAEAVDSILDKGVVIDVFVRVSLIGIELLTVEARVVIASVDTYLQFADAVARLSSSGQRQSQTQPLLSSHRQARHRVEGPVGRTAVAASTSPGSGSGSALVGGPAAASWGGGAPEGVDLPAAVGPGQG